MPKLTEPQRYFLEKLHRGEAVTRTLSNRTAQALRTMGLISYAMMQGWVLTEAGINTYDQVMAGTRE